MNKTNWFITLCLLVFGGVLALSFYVFRTPKSNFKTEVSAGIPIFEWEVNDTTTVQKTELWVVDTIVHKDKYYIISTHNLAAPKLGAKFIDSIKPTYTQKDTIKL